jgi:hypothetical protein
MRAVILIAIFVWMTAPIFAEETSPEAFRHPLVRDFLGVNGHFTFKPELYRPVCGLVRNYHNLSWDVKAPGDPITLPDCVNRVNWETNVYGPWKKAGFETDICAMFGEFGSGKKGFEALWEGREAWAEEYGFALARYFGPYKGRSLCTSIEIDNEPGNEFPDSLYQTLFTRMAHGIRRGDPRIKIVTCAVRSGVADKYVKSLEETFSSAEIKPLFDVINLHLYAQKPQRPGQSPWDRSYPEDPNIDYLRELDAAIAWRNRETPGKEIWVTEFGYDSCTDAAMKKRSGWFEKLNWRGVTDLQQAQYLVRSILCFSERDVNRAYLYFYDDNDSASVHGASGLTRHFQPKPSYWAVKHLYETLGDYRFQRVVKKTGGALCVYEFVSGSDPDSFVWVAWSPTNENRETEVTLTDLPAPVLSLESMPLAKGRAPQVLYTKTSPNAIKLQVTESPVYIRLRK